MPIRKAAVAGQFYEGSAKACLAQLQEMTPKMLPAADIAEQTIKAGIEAKSPLQRVTTPDDIARAIVGLITGPDLTTGHVLPVEGGLTISV